MMLTDGTTVVGTGSWANRPIAVTGANTFVFLALRLHQPETHR